MKEFVVIKLKRQINMNSDYNCVYLQRIHYKYNG